VPTWGGTEKLIGKEKRAQGAGTKGVEKIKYLGGFGGKHWDTRNPVKPDQFKNQPQNFVWDK